MHIGKSASIYLVTGITQKAVPFLLLPVLTRYLVPEEYGIIALYQVAIGFCAPFIGMGMHINISRNFSRVTNGEMGRWIGNLICLLGFTTGIVVFLFSIYLAAGGRSFGIPTIWFMSIPVVVGSRTIYQLNLTVLRNQERPIVFGAFEIINTLVNLFVSILFVVIFGFGWQGRGIGIVSASFIFGFVGFQYLRRQGLCIFEASLAKMKEISRICVPLIPHAAGIVVITMSDRLFIDHMVGKEAVGIYTVGYTFGMIVNLFVESFGRAWSPWFFRQVNDTSANSRLRVVRYSYYYFAGIVVVSFAVTGASQLVLPIMVGAQYHGATRFIMWIALGYAFRGMYTIVFPYLVNETKTNFVGIMTAFAAILNLIGNYFLIKLNGPIGAAQSTLLAFAVSFFGTWWYAHSIYPMPWNPIFLLKPVKEFSSHDNSDH